MARIFKVAQMGDFECVMFPVTEKGVRMVVLITVINFIRVEGTKVFGSEVDRFKFVDDFGTNSAHSDFINDAIKLVKSKDIEMKSKGQILLGDRKL